MILTQQQYLSIAFREYFQVLTSQGFGTSLDSRERDPRPAFLKSDTSAAIAQLRSLAAVVRLLATYHGLSRRGFPRSLNPALKPT
jgi:hypothetical protein